MQSEHVVQNPGNKLFSRGQILLAGVLGGPLGAAWAARSTADALEAPAMAKRLLWVGVALLLLMLIVATLIPTDAPNNPVFAILFFMPVVLMFDSSLRNKCNEALEGGVKKRSWWKAAGVGAVGLLVTSVLIGTFFLFSPWHPINTIEHGDNIIYYEGDATAEDASSLARLLENKGVFHPGAAWTLTLVYPRNQSGTMILEMPFLEPVENTEMHEMLRLLREDLQLYYVSKKVEIDVQNAFGVTTLRIQD